MKYTNEMKINGEMAIRGLSKKAQKFYGETDPMNVYAYGDLYAYDGCMGNAEDLTLEQLERTFEEMYDDLNPQDENIERLYKHLGIDIQSATDDMENGYLTENEGRDGKTYWWYMYADKNAAIDEDGNITEDEKAIEDLFC